MNADWLNSLPERRRQRVFAVMREIGMEATCNAYAAQEAARKFDADAPRLRLLATGAEAFLEALRRGSTPDQASLTAMSETASKALQLNIEIGSGTHHEVPHQYITECLGRVIRAREGATT